MELWNSIVHDLTSCKQKNASEEQYQDKIERIFERLGWWRTDSHKYKKPIPWGSAKDLIPDIQLLKDCKEVLVVEIKKPNNILTERQVRQLDSYMHALKIQIGLYIGENIQLFYESENEKTPTSVCTIEINEDSTEGKELCNMLVYDKFDYEGLKSFCIKQRQRIEIEQNSRIRLKEFFEDEHCEHNIKELLRDKFLSEGLDGKIVSEFVTKFDFVIRKHEFLQPQQGILGGKAERILPSNNDTKEEFSLDRVHFYGVGPFVWEVIKRYIDDHPSITYEELERRFPSDLSCSKPNGVVRRDVFIEKYPNKKRNYFIKKPIELTDGTKVIVHKEWGNTGNSKPYFQRFLEHVKNYYTIYTR